MAEETTTAAKHLTLNAFKAGIKKALQSVKDFFIDASGHVKTSLIPLGEGLKVDAETGTIAVDTAALNIEIPEAITAEEAIAAVDEAYAEVFTTGV